MTLEELRTSTQDVLTPAQIAPIIKADAQAIRITARQAPERLGFPVAVIGTRVKIPRLAFLRWLDGEGGPNGL